ncbi:GPP34 family phosphoprotein [Streptomyces sp. NPDC000987]|uniref:GOLPH3/VPS74 family protein n=1 Tax=Streptomyces sp. NPDC000987 TaxID=3154374 RepID=UPI003318DE59
MNTARDLAILALDVAPGHPVEQGDLSLALAGAEVLDLVDALALFVDGDRLVPAAQSVTGDPLLDRAASSLVRQEPYESVEDWLWRRGRGLSAAYADAMEREGLTTRPRGRRIPLRTGRTVLVDSPARSRAAARRTAGEPVLAALAAAAGVLDRPTGSSGPTGPLPDEVTDADDVVTTVLAAVGDAVMELEAVRQRRAVEESAYANLWRGQ